MKYVFDVSTKSNDEFLLKNPNSTKGPVRTRFCTKDESEEISEVLLKENKSPNQARKGALEFKEFDDDFGEDEGKVTKMLFEIENEILQSQLLRKEKISDSSVDFSKRNIKQKSTDYFNPLEKIQKIKIENLSTQTEHYRNLYIATSSDLKTLKGVMAEHEKEIEATKSKSKTLKEEIENKNKTIRSLEFQISKQRNQFESKKARLEHEFRQTKRSTEDKLITSGTTGCDPNEAVKREYSQLKDEKCKLEEKLAKIRKWYVNKENDVKQSKKHEQDCQEMEEEISNLAAVEFVEKGKRDLLSEKYNYSMDALNSLEKDLSLLRDTYSGIENEDVDLELVGKSRQFEADVGANERLGSKLKKIIEENKDLKDKETTLNGELRKLESDFSSKMKEQTNEINQLKVFCPTKPKESKEREELSYKNLETKFTEHQQMCQELKSAIHSYDAELREKEDDNAHLQSKVTELENFLKFDKECRRKVIQRKKDDFESEIRRKRLINDLIIKNNILYDQIKSQGGDPQNSQFDDLYRRLNECELMIQRMHNTAETSLKDALSSASLIQDQLKDINEKTAELKASDNCLREHRKMNDLGDLNRSVSLRQRRIEDIQNLVQRPDLEIQASHFYRDMVHIDAIEKRSIRLRELINDIKNNII